MNTASATPASSSTTFYYTRKARGATLALATFIALVPFAGAYLTSLEEQDPEFFLPMLAIMSILFWPMAASMIFYAYRSHFVISSSGVEAFTAEGHYQTTWSNIERIDTIPFSANSLFKEGLFLKEPALRFRWWTFLSRRTLRKWGIDRFIPLEHFSNDWRNGELGKEIRRYAPHLFEGELAGKTTLFRTDRYKKQSSGFEGLLIALGIWLVVNLASSLVVIVSDTILLFVLFSRSSITSGEPPMQAAIGGFSSSLINSAFIFEITVSILTATVCALLFMLLFKRSRLFVKTALAFIALRIVFGFMNFAFINYARQAIGAESTSILILNGLALTSVLIAGYLTTSQKVKETFVNQ